MGPDGAANLIPIFGMITGVFTTGLFFWGIVKLAQSQVGAALARRIQGQHGGGADAELQADMSYLRAKVEALRQEITVTHERLDFTERLLAQRAPDRLPQG